MQTMQEIAQTLEQIGLTRNEARVYLALASCGASTAYHIAQHCDVKKPTVYLILEELRKKGLVLKIPHAKKALYCTADIADYIREQEKKYVSARSILPAIYALGDVPRSNVYVFTGLRGIAQAMEHKFENMRDKTFRSFYSKFTAGNKEIMRLYSAWDKKAIMAGMSFKIIMSEEKHELYYKDIFKFAQDTDQVEIRILKNYAFPSSVSIEIAEDFVRIIDEKSLQATIVDNKATADAMRQIFQNVWMSEEKSGKPLRH